MSKFILLKIVAELAVFTPVLLFSLTETFCKPLAPKDTVWYDAKDFPIEGRGWQNPQMESVFDRLPAKAAKMVRPPVWNLAHNTAGLSIRFTTKADSFFIKWSLRDSALSMNHMPATGVSGIDIYYKKNGSWFYLETGRPSKVKRNIVKIFKPAKETGTEEYLVNFPLYNGVRELLIGLAPEFSLEKCSPVNKKPVVIYGTSIAQGGCASRPGMAYSSIISRRMNQPVINLGFSGNGRLDIEICELISELDPALYVIDCMRNLTTEQVKNLTEPFLRLLRKNKPGVPILLIDQTDFRMDFPNERSDMLYSFYKKLAGEGDKNIYYLEGNNLLGKDGEGTVDGTHPTDLGFSRMADVIQKKFEEILK
jgi:lysophospholipase L1-like esterase